MKGPKQSVEVGLQRKEMRAPPQGKDLEFRLGTQRECSKLSPLAPLKVGRSHFPVVKQARKRTSPLDLADPDMSQKTGG